MIVRELIAKIGLDFDSSAFDKAESAVGKFGSKFAGFATVIGLAHGALTALTVSVADNAVKLSNMSQKLGIGTDELQELGYAGKAVGVSMESMEGALTHIRDQMVEAQASGKGMSLAFFQAGISMHDATTGKLKPASQVLQDLAEKMKNTPNAARRVFLANQIIGGSADDMMRLLLKGKDGFKAYADEARAAGAILQQDFIKQSVEFNAKMKSSIVIMEGLRNVIAVKVLPYLNKTVESFNKWFKANNSNVKSLLSYGSQVVMNTVTVLATAIEKIVDFFKGLGDTLDTLHPGLSKVALAMGLVAAAFTFTRGPLVLFITALALIIDDFKVFMDGGNSLFGRFADWLGEILGVTNGAQRMREVFEALGDGHVFERISDYFGEMIDDMLAAWDKFKGTLGAGFEVLSNLFGGGSTTSVSQLMGTAVGGGATSPAAAAAIGASNSAISNTVNAAKNFASNSQKSVTTNHVNIKVDGGNPQEVVSAIEAYFNEQTQSAFAAGTPGVDLPVGAQ